MSEETAESVLSPNQLPPRHYYRVAGVGVVTVCVLIVVATALLGYSRFAVFEAAALTGALTIIRLLRPEGTWIQARSRFEDLVVGTGLTVGLVLLSTYANLPRIY